MALRMPLETHFEHFWAQLAKWLSGCLWKLILSISGRSSPNGSQDASGGSFSAFLGAARQMALRKPLEAHFEHFCAQRDPLMRTWRHVDEFRSMDVSTPNVYAVTQT